MREQPLRRSGAQRDDHFGLDCCDLPHQKRRTGFAFVALRLPVSGRTALYDVRDVNILAAQAHRLDHVVQQLPRAADERFPLRVFIRAGAFAHEYQFGVRIADAEYDLACGLAVEFAARAVAEIFANDLERRSRIGNTLLGPRKSFSKMLVSTTPRATTDFLAAISSRVSDSGIRMMMT